MLQIVETMFQSVFLVYYWWPVKSSTLWESGPSFPVKVPTWSITSTTKFSLATPCIKRIESKHCSIVGHPVYFSEIKIWMITITNLMQLPIEEVSYGHKMLDNSRLKARNLKAKLLQGMKLVWNTSSSEQKYPSFGDFWKYQTCEKSDNVHELVWKKMKDTHFARICSLLGDNVQKKEAI